MTAPYRIPHSVELRGMDLVTLEISQSAEGRAREGRFGLMFKLPPFDPPPALLEVLAQQMAQAEPVENASTIASGYTVLGQFITHDLTYDTTPLEIQRDDPLAEQNFRTARLDLDSVY